MIKPNIRRKVHVKICKTQQKGRKRKTTHIENNMT